MHASSTYSNQLFKLTLFMSLLVVSFSIKAEESHIHQHVWQLTHLDQTAIAAENKPYFLFTENGDVYGYGVCNYFAGKFKINHEEDFLLTRLERSNNVCENDEDIEIKLMASMLMSNRFKIESNQLKLMSDEQWTAGFEPNFTADKNNLIKEASQLKIHKKPITRSNKKNKRAGAKNNKVKNKAAKQTNNKKITPHQGAKKKPQVSKKTLTSKKPSLKKTRLSK